MKSTRRSFLQVLGLALVAPVVACVKPPAPVPVIPPAETMIAAGGDGGYLVIKEMDARISHALANAFTPSNLIRKIQRAVPKVREVQFEDGPEPGTLYVGIAPVTTSNLVDVLFLMNEAKPASYYPVKVGPIRNPKFYTFTRRANGVLSLQRG